MNFFDAAPFFMTRCALLSIDLDHSDPKSMINFYRETPLFQEAIAIASPSLHLAMKKLDDRSLSQVFPSLLKYFLRMQSRVTPFGLFSSVGIGSFDTTPQVRFTPEAIEKRIRPDMGWMQSVIQFCHGRYDVVKQLQVLTNPVAIQQADRILLSQVSDKTKELISIKRTIVAEQIFALAQKPICYAALERQLCDIFHQYESEMVCNYLWQFFTKNFLLSELSIRVDREFSLDQWVSQLPQSPEELSFLKKVALLMGRYQNLGNEGLALLEELQNEMEVWKKVDYPLLVDSRISETIQLPPSVGCALEEVGTALVLLSNTEAPRDLKAFTDKFLEKYGTTRLVPLLELLNPYEGLGLPESMKGSSSQPEEETKDPLIHSLLRNHEGKEVNLEALLANSPLEERGKNAPLSMELYFEVAASSQDALAKGDYTIILNSLVASNQAGSTFGRFLYLLNPQERENLRKLLAKEEALLTDVLFVEAAFAPENARTSNVCFFEKNRPAQLLLHYHEPSHEQLGGSIHLDDIYVGATDQHLFFFSKRLQKELYFTSSSAVNLELGPSPIRFIIEMSHARFHQFSPFPWNLSRNTPYLPRVRYKNIIFSLAQWHFDQKSLNITPSTPIEKASNLLREALQGHQVPHKIFLTQYDHRLALNWSCETHFDLLLHHLMQHESLLLLEQYSDNKIITSSHGKHAAEFVLPLIKKEGYRQPQNRTSFPSTSTIARKERLSLPGGEWLYAKLFLPQEGEEAFLKEQIPHFITSLQEDQLLAQWFFVRYQEEHSHVRLRLKPHHHEQYASLLSRLHGWAETLILNGQLADLSIHTYEKEIERYGGKSCLEAAEAFFCADSACCIHLLQLAEELKEVMPLHGIGALGVMHILRSFYDTPFAMESFLQSAQRDAHLLTGFRPLSTKLTEWAITLFFNAKEDPLLTPLKSCFSKVDPFLLALNNVMEASSKTNLIESIIHMRCNRLMGIDHAKEKKARVIAHATCKKIPHLINKPGALHESKSI
ncbi:MAG: lantibiotic dehydratase [Parachlamydia sp.]|nr:lantibiotic dehydratase [Parachlamydia sp.]